MLESLSKGSEKVEASSDELAHAKLAKPVPLDLETFSFSHQGAYLLKPRQI